MYRCEKFRLRRQRTSVRPSVRPYRLWGRGREVPRQPGRELRMPSFLGGKSRGAFGQPAFFLAGNRMTIVAFEKEVEKKHLIPINGKKKFKRILVVGENFKLRKLPSKDLIAFFSSRRRACLVLKHNRVSEVFKGFKVHDFEYLLRSKKLHFEIEFMSLEMCHLLLTSKNY